MKKKTSLNQSLQSGGDATVQALRDAQSELNNRDIDVVRLNAAANSQPRYVYSMCYR